MAAAPVELPAAVSARDCVARYEFENQELRDHVRRLKQVLALREAEASQYSQLLEQHYQEGDALLHRHDSLLLRLDGVAAASSAAAAAAAAAVSAAACDGTFSAAWRPGLSLQQCVAPDGEGRLLGCTPPAPPAHPAPGKLPLERNSEPPSRDASTPPGR
eukprot:TRINITY_DN72042_c0_g1_i1.p1 TRINITY_DN72042_c0_g1~~TRINITY_DN72042_c0_g1_i1.p1  ORF type:complete len:160 (-),score=42.82 TRINITY_DN72042_c0_g1_i1:131-610(-)